MKSIEPIIRLVKYQLSEVLPVTIGATAPDQTDETDETYLQLDVPAQVRNSYRAVEQRIFPALVISPISSEPENAGELLDDPDADCVRWMHTFEVRLALTDAGANAEDLTYKLSRYCELLQDCVTGFDETALLAAFTASRISAVPVQIVPGAVVYEEPGDKSIMLRTASLEFTAYC